MGTEMQHRSASRFYKSRFVGFVCLYLVAAAALFLLSDFLITPEPSAQVTDWQYVCANRLVDLDDSRHQWQEADAQHKPEINSDESYILLQRTFRETESGWLHIKTDHALMLITVNEMVVYDTLSGSDAFQTAALSRIDLTGSGDKLVEITLYNPLSFSFSAVLSDSPAADHAFGGYLVFCLVGGILFLLLGVIAVMAWGIIKKLRASARSTLLFIAAAFFCSAAALFLLRVASIRDEGMPASVYSLVRMLLDFAVFLAPLGVAVDLCGWNGKLEVVSALNVLYAAAILFWPYEVFYVALIQLGFVFQLALLLVLLMLFRQSAFSRRPFSALSAMVFFVPVLFFSLDTRFRICENAWVFSYIAVLFTGTFQLATGLWLAFRTGKRAATPRVSPAAPAEKPVRRAKEPGHILSLSQKMDTRLSQLVSEKCNPPDRHMLHVAEYSRAIAARMGLDAARVDEIAEAALLHDIGKLMIPGNLLTKPGNLTEAEFDEIRHHHLYGEQILSGTGSAFFDLAATIAREHHEHVDGSGYLGYTGEQISLPAKIVAVADVFDALTTDRSYKKTWNFDEAFRYIMERAGSYYDADVVKAFAQAKRKIYELYTEYHGGTSPAGETRKQGGMRK